MLQVEHVVGIARMQRVPAIPAFDQSKWIEADDAMSHRAASRGGGLVDLPLGIDHDGGSGPSVRLGIGEIGNEETRRLALAWRRNGSERPLHGDAHGMARLRINAEFQALVHGCTLS